MDDAARAHSRASWRLERTMSAIRSEKYVVRPFEKLDSAEDALEAVRLDVDEQSYEPGSVVLDAHSLSASTLHLSMPTTGEIITAVEGTPLSPLDCGVVIVARAITNRWSHVVLRDYVRYLQYDEGIAIDRSDDPLVFADRGGFVITVAIVLLHELQAEPLRPSSTGTWLARREFRVVPERAEFSFSPDELTDDIRSQFSLPASTPSFVFVDRDQLVGADDLSEAVSVYLDTDILRLLQQSQSDALSVHIQAELAVTTMSAVARAAIDAISDELGRCL